MSKARLTTEEIKRQLNQPGFRNLTPIPRLTDAIADTLMVVSIDSLHTYEHNPRQTRNPLYDDIKTSIRERGLDQPPTITKRPNQEFYIIRNGGNTRLAILNELWQETGDKKYYNIPCLYKPWQSEVSVLAGHLAENELRGDLTFIEKSKAVLQMKRLYEEADTDNTPLFISDLAEKLKQDGYPLSRQLLGRMMDCLKSLYSALPQALEGGMGKRKVEEFLKFKNELIVIWKKYDTDEDNFLNLWISTLSSFDDPNPDTLSVDKVQDALLGAISSLLGQAQADIEMDLHLLRRAQGKTFPGKSEPADTDNAEDAGEAEEGGADGLEAVDRPLSDIPANIATPFEVSTYRPQPEAKPRALRTQQRVTPPAKHADGLSHVALPMENPQLHSIGQRLNGLEGVQQPHFAEIKAIPLTAGGGLCEVSDVWHIDSCIDTPEMFREQIALLAQDIAAIGQVKGIVSTDEGLGFSCSDLSHEHASLGNAAALLLTALVQKAEKSHTSVPLDAALFGQALTGCLDLRGSTQKAPHSLLERLPDIALVKLFRLIRLARHLVDLLKEEERRQ